MWDSLIVVAGHFGEPSTLRAQELTCHRSRNSPKLCWAWALTLILIYHCFRMKMEDFCVYYQEMDICCDSPNFVDGDAACQWNCSLKEGRWEAGKSAGGSDNGGEVWAELNRLFIVLFQSFSYCRYVSQAFRSRVAHMQLAFRPCVKTRSRSMSWNVL